MRGPEPVTFPYLRSVLNSEAGQPSERVESRLIAGRVTCHRGMYLRMPTLDLGRQSHVRYGEPSAAAKSRRPDQRHQ